MTKFDEGKWFETAYHEPSENKTYTQGYMKPASAESIEKVLMADENDPDGRSEYMWVRLANGDLILGVFPQGDTYVEVTADASYDYD